MSKSQKKGKSFQGSVVPDYISELPDAIPPGRILVHNSVRPAKRMGYRGFRAWLSFPKPKYVICDCKWASNLGEHYRVGYPPMTRFAVGSDRAAFQMLSDFRNGADLGERIRATQSFGCSIFIHDLLPLDLKIKLETFTREQAMNIARFLANVVGKAHPRQMDADTDRNGPRN